MSNLLNNLFKVALGAGVVYTAYKIGQSNGENKESELIKKAKEDLEFEINFVSDLIKGHRDEPNKTQKNLDDIKSLSEDLDKLKTKLEELKNRK